MKGFLARRPTWLVRPLGVNVARRQAEVMELEAQRFYQRAIARTTDASTRELLNKLADEERKHTQTAGNLEEKHLTQSAKMQEDESHRKLFLLQIVQPGLAGLMDGSVSTLAPLFAAAFATHKSWDAFLVGLAASVGAGISMGFAESLSDDGSLTGRGSPWIRGAVTGLMTTAGGIGHTLPFMISNFHLATTDCDLRGGRGTRGDRLHSAPLYGHAVFAGGVSGDCWRAAGVFYGVFDREFVRDCERAISPNSYGSWQLFESWVSSGDSSTDAPTTNGLRLCLGAEPAMAVTRLYHRAGYGLVRSFTRS